VPTFLIGEVFESNDSESGAQDRMIKIQRENNLRYYNCIQNAVQAGVKIALGSDFVGWDPVITAREFECMVRLGKMSPMQSIYAGTGSAADLLDIDNIGRILPGNLADLVVVQGNPIDNISVLEKEVIFVMKNGIVARDDLNLFAMHNRNSKIKRFQVGAYF
jgi:imidazolonepropionase-like amidohydrolase